jgi:hypothetical protein
VRGSGLRTTPKKLKAVKIVKRGVVFLLLLVCCVVPLLSACKFSKGERARAMERELEQKIKDGISANATRADVEAFIDKLSIEGERPTRQKYSTDFSRFDTGSEAPKKPEAMPMSTVGHIIAKWGSVDHDSSVMYNIGLYAIFFFDGQDRLATYSVQRYFSH